MSERWFGWHFLPDNGRIPTRFDSRGRRNEYANKLVKVWQRLVVPPESIALCEYGLHASRRAIDALQYAPGAIACRVELSGRIIEGDDKAVASERTVLAMIDATKILHECAVEFAHEALIAERKAGREPDARSWQALDVKRRWLNGEASGDELSAAWSAAEGAAEMAAESAAWSAAESAAEGAAESAAWSVAESAAEGAAESAAWSAASAAWSVAWRAAEMAAWRAAWSVAWRAAEGAAESAAEMAAWSVAERAQNELLESKLSAAMTEWVD